MPRKRTNCQNVCDAPAAIDETPTIPAPAIVTVRSPNRSINAPTKKSPPRRVSANPKRMRLTPASPRPKCFANCGSAGTISPYPSMMNSVAPITARNSADRIEM